MAYVDQEKKEKIIRNVIRVMDEYGMTRTTGWRYTFKVTRGTIELRIWEAPWNVLLDLNESLIDRSDLYYRSINTYYPADAFDPKTKAGPMLARQFTRIVEALNTDNYDRSDAMSDYFCVGHYIGITFGTGEQPFKVNGKVVGRGEEALKRVAHYKALAAQKRSPRRRAA